jgi:UDPglucose 6-dehydrogenase
MKITVHGCGYVGLVQATVLADAGHDVICSDVDERRVAGLRLGHLPIYEPGLADLLAQNAEAGRLSFTSDAQEAVDHGDVQFIAVGTPQGEDGSADINHVMSVARTIGDLASRAIVVVLKSTVPVGTGDLVELAISRRLAERGQSKITVGVVSNPEFLKEGAAIADCTKPDRIIIGTESAHAEAAMRELYAPFNRTHEKIMVMDRRSAELTKYAANCMLATKISFINEIANIADLYGADIESVRRGIGADPRIGYQFIYPGAGYGGSCFPKDVRALVQSAVSAGLDPVVLKAVETRNNLQKSVLARKVAEYFDGDLVGRTFALWGLSFKPNTDDMRDAPARDLMEALWAAGARVRAYDPKAMSECHRLFGARADLELCATANDALTGAEALILVTEWKNFQAPDFEVIRRSLSSPVIFDGRNIYDPASAMRYGVTVVGVGRRSLNVGAARVRRMAQSAA